jgi:hypothetical protein
MQGAAGIQADILNTLTPLDNNGGLSGLHGGHEIRRVEGGGGVGKERNRGMGRGMRRNKGMAEEWGEE